MTNVSNKIASIRFLTNAMLTSRKAVPYRALHSSSTDGPLPTFRVNSERRIAEVILPGYNYSDLDRVGRVKIWRMAALSEAARCIVYNPNRDPTPPAVIETFKQFGNIAIFLAATRYEISEEFYQKQHYYNPIRYEYQLANVSKTSYTQVLTSYSEFTGKQLTRDTMVKVMVDVEKRAPKKLPDTFSRFLFGVAVPPSDVSVPPILRTIQKPGDAMSHVVTVDTTTLDFYYHTNQAFYLKFLHDAASALTFSGQLQLGCKDFAEERIKTMEMVFKSESNAGDKLTVYCWQSGQREVSFQIENLLEDRVVLQARFELYHPRVTSLY